MKDNSIGIRINVSILKFKRHEKFLENSNETEFWWFIHKSRFLVIWGWCVDQGYDGLFPEPKKKKTVEVRECVNVIHVESRRWIASYTLVFVLTGSLELQTEGEGSRGSRRKTKGSLTGSLRETRRGGPNHNSVYPLRVFFMAELGDHTLWLSVVKWGVFNRWRLYFVTDYSYYCSLDYEPLCCHRCLYQPSLID